jgi:uncharacterized protein (TIGR03435 family)
MGHSQEVTDLLVMPSQSAAALEGDCADRRTPTWSIAGKWLLATVRVLVVDVPVVIGLLAAPGGKAQTAPGERPTFEVASVKRHREIRGNYRLPTFSNDRFTFAGPVALLIAVAYHLPFNPSKRLSGGPDWIRGPEGLYDIDAKGSFPDGLSSRARDERGRLMLQALLADRFRLTIHREMKEMPVYVLSVDKGGPKLEKADISEKDCSQSATDGQIPCHQFNGGRGRGLHARAVTMADLVSYVENWTDRPLLDKTGVLGLYKIETQPFLPMEVAAAPPAPGTKGEAGIDLADLPTLFQVFERLGLKMKPEKDKVETYVIDDIQRPTDN